MKHSVMRGLVIHVFLCGQDADGRDMHDHDDLAVDAIPSLDPNSEPAHNITTESCIAPANL
jgi:hypothetical protein